MSEESIVIARKRPAILPLPQSDFSLVGQASEHRKAIEPLREGAVHVWRGHISSLDNWTDQHYCAKILSKYEASVVKAYVAPTSANEFILGRLMLRTALSLYYPGLSPRQWEFGFGRHGKPHLESPVVDPNLQFNLSHSHGLVVLALTLGGQVGIDVEGSNRSIDLAQFDQVLSHQETVMLRQTNEVTRFSDLWALKEAYLKARGIGISIPLDQISFELSNSGREEIAFRLSHALGDDPTLWWFYLDSFREKSLAIAVNRNGKSEDILYFDYDPNLVSCLLP